MIAALAGAADRSAAEPPSASRGYVTDKAALVLQALQTRRFDDARTTIDDIAARSTAPVWRFFPFDAFIKDFPWHADPTLGDRLDEWVAHDPRSDVAYLMRASYNFASAWRARGHGYASSVLPANARVFEHDMEQARGDAARAISLNDANPYSRLLFLDIEARNGDSAESGNAFQSAIQRFPDYLPLYIKRQERFAPKWNGAMEDMNAFTARYAEHAADGSPLSFLWLTLYQQTLYDAGWLCIGVDAEKTKSCIAGQMDKLGAGRLEHPVQEVLQHYQKPDLSVAARHEFALALATVLDGMARVRGGEEYFGALLQLAAAATGTDLRLEPEDASRNLYVLDQVAAEHWALESSYDNAEKKYRQALAEADVAEFPSQEEKDLAAASIQDGLVVAYMGRSNWPKVIESWDASVRLAGDRENGLHVEKCRALYNLKRYLDARGACAAEVDRTGDIYAVFWRGEASRALGDDDAASRDFAAVAEAGVGNRSLAAGRLESIYAKRKQYAAMLEAMGKYPFQFDEKNESASELAITFNNRCFARMKLDQLQPALADCTKSLKYGSLPDAFAKQQELVARLKAETEPGGRL